MVRFYSDPSVRSYYKWTLFIKSQNSVLFLNVTLFLVETVIDFIFLSSKINAVGDCSHEIKKHLFLEGKVMTNLGSILKSMTLLCQQRSI